MSGLRHHTVLKPEDALVFPYREAQEVAHMLPTREDVENLQVVSDFIRGHQSDLDLYLTGSIVQRHVFGSQLSEEDESLMNTLFGPAQAKDIDVLVSHKALAVPSNASKRVYEHHMNALNDYLGVVRKVHENSSLIVSNSSLADMPFKDVPTYVRGNRAFHIDVLEAPDIRAVYVNSEIVGRYAFRPLNQLGTLPIDVSFVEPLSEYIIAGK